MLPVIFTSSLFILNFVYNRLSSYIFESLLEHDDFAIATGSDSLAMD